MRISLAAAVDEVAARDPVLTHRVALAGPIKHRPRDPDDGPFGALLRAIVPRGERFRPYRPVVARYCWAAVALLRGGTDPALR